MSTGSLSQLRHRGGGGSIGSVDRSGRKPNPASDSVAVTAEDVRKQSIERHKKCRVCSRIPYRGTEMIAPLINEQDGLGLDFDDGIYEYIYKMAHHDREDSARVDHATAVRTKDRCNRHNRKLQSELAKAGIIKEAGQKYSGDSLNRARMIAPFEPEEIRLGHMLGTGGFSSVFEIACFQQDSQISGKVSAPEQEARAYLTKNAQRTVEPSDHVPLHRGRKKNNKGPEDTIARYALKHLRRGLTKEPERFERAAIDLVLEAQLLLAMDHPNIVSLRGWSYQGVEGYSTGRSQGFFIIIDRLPETLEDRIFSWRVSMRRYKNRFKLPWAKTKFSTKLDQLACERLQVAHDVAAALEYMHDRRIINRDLKASNIGFDIYGELKLFDFGLSRLLPFQRDSNANQDGTYLMSRVGTKYYMAPEIRKKMPYGLSADVYSYGVCLWEILSVGSPREALKHRAKHVQSEEVAAVRCPLPICQCWPSDISNLLVACISNTPMRRPPIAEVRYIMEQLMAQFMDNLGLKRRMDTKQRRSTLRIDLSLLADLNLSCSSLGESNTMVAEESLTVGSHDLVHQSFPTTTGHESISVIETASVQHATREDPVEQSDAESKREISGGERDDWGTAEVPFADDTANIEPAVARAGDDLQVEPNASDGSTEVQETDVK